jgi:hypothetical protein
MIRQLIAALTFVGAFGPALAASAALIDLGSVTRDPETNLDWLDVDVTAGLSYDQVVASALILDDGWRHATESELCAFLGGACPGIGSVSRSELMPLWNPRELSAIYAGPSASGFHPLVQWALTGPQYDVGSFNFSDSNSGQNAIGSALVRVVPEPGVVVLLGLGLSALIIGRPRIDPE